MATDDKRSDDDKIVAEAKKRFERCQTWESDARKNFVEDIKFANGDPENGWQWDNDIRSGRVTRQKPCLTINKVRTHNLMIINDAKQNKPGVNIRPVGDRATYEAAQVFEGIVRHIEYQSNAEQAYDCATVSQVQGGIGYWRVVTDYVSDDSFDQEIYIRRVKNPDSIYLDPDITEADGSDARFGFVFEDMPRDEFEAQYPEFLDVNGSVALGNEGDDWIGEDHVRVAEYYERTQKKDKLVTFLNPLDGQQVVMRMSEMNGTPFKKLYQQVKEQPTTQARAILTDEIMWYKIAGDKIVERRPWLGKYVPIVRIIGEEVVVQGKLDRKGHTRAMKDAQKMYNYWTSEATAQVALQTKTPYVAPAEAIEGLETYWEKQNLDDAAVLPYNQYTEAGNELAAPRREQPPVMAEAYIRGMQICQDQMMMASGQYQSQFGQNENATSGKAINERQRQGDTATYHFIDNLAIGIRYTGKILIDLIPKIYDTQRVIRIMAKSGDESQIKVDPSAPHSYQEVGESPDEVAAIFNPNVGRYEVESDIGPGYATRRQESFNAMTQIAAQNPEFMNLAGDLLWKSADFPLADELADRWSRVIPPAVMGKGPSPQEQQLQQQLQQAHDAIVQLQQKLTDKDKDINVRSFEAETKRITAIGNAGPIITAEQIQPLIRQALLDMLTGGAPETFNPQGAQEMPSGGADAAFPMIEGMPGQVPQGDSQPPMPQAGMFG